MPRPNIRWARWQGVSLIAITFVYFLIFAQFAFLKRLAGLDITDTHLKAVMAAMAMGGILLSLLAPRVTVYESPGLRLRIALTACAAAAFLILLPLGLVASMAVAFLIGGGIGLLTVTLVTHLRLWLGPGHPVIGVGIGTGVGYFICNIPALFTAPAQVQAVAAGCLCLAGVLCTFQPPVALPNGEALAPPKNTLGFARVLISFTALVWLDSAAFFIIQNTPALKAGTWQGAIHLWSNGILHFAGALLSVWLLRNRGLSRALSFAFLALAFACLLLLDPSRAVLASVFYPVGVSLYSVALVAYPSLLAPAASAAERGRQAGWIYATAGWFGSAMGIGMGQNLGYVPPAFVVIAGLLILLPGVVEIVRHRRCELIATAVILLTAFGIERTIAAMRPARPTISQSERGRMVYISEGCINCHSQYVRPDTTDVLLWGPAQTLDDVRREHPPLIGNRRQGPDLAEVGTRRSPLWLKAHLYNPSEVSHASFMPTYAFLFHDRRGDDLVAYLHNLRGTGVQQHLLTEDSWRTSSQANADADPNQGPAIFRVYCRTCHDAEGATRRAWQRSFQRLPPNLALGPYLHVAKSDSTAQRIHRFAQIVKFGVPGTDMPGHEYLSDREIASLSLWLAQRSAQSEPTHNTSGETQ
jgi:cytochrome c oxidase cbb3-type subunit 2